MTATPPPIVCEWNGESFVPLKRFGPLCDRHYVVGETYPLVVQEQRSRASHNHYFAALHEAWANLPEVLAERFATVREAVVTVYTAKSQSLRAMGKADFQASKDAVLGIVSEMVGTTPAELRREAGRAA